MQTILLSEAACCILHKERPICNFRYSQLIESGIMCAASISSECLSLQNAHCRLYVSNTLSRKVFLMQPLFDIWGYIATLKVNAFINRQRAFKNIFKCGRIVRSYGKRQVRRIVVYHKHRLHSEILAFRYTVKVYQGNLSFHCFINLPASFDTNIELFTYIKGFPPTLLWI